MSDTPISMIYLLGAGRSGTTLLAAVLNDHPRIRTIGEMHQFLEYLEENKACSCGEALSHCPFWGKVVRNLDFDSETIKEARRVSAQYEKHAQIPLLLLGKGAVPYYDSLHAQILRQVQEGREDVMLLDSSKYIARYLRVRRNDQLQVKGIYLVRDVRGVISSFGKQVQTPKGPIATILYYSLINLMGQLVCWSDPGVIKIRYEDFVTDPQRSLARMEAHFFGNTDYFKSATAAFDMPHIIGGNRMKTQKVIHIAKDEKWRETISRPRQIVYYFLCLPFMILNRYKI